MKILMILDHEFPPDIRVENEIQSLFETGHEVHLACYTQKGRPIYEVTGNCTIHRKPISNFIHKSSVGALKFPFYFNYWRRFLTTIFKKDSFDAIHIHDLPLAKVGYKFSKMYKTPFILDLHENWPALLETSVHANTFLGRLLSNTNQWRRYEKKYILKAKLIITVVEEMKERICRLGVRPDKVIVVSNTFNLDKPFDLNSNDKNDNTILYYAGGINKHRGLQIVIRSLKYILPQTKKITLRIVGSGKYVHSLKQIVRAENLSEYVEFVGQKSYEETMELLSKSDIALIPHLKSEQTDNSSPNKLFQYMYFKKPVIVSNCSSLERIIKEASCGAVYQFDDPSSLAKVILNLMNSDLIKKLGENGRNAVIKKFNWKVSVNPLLTMYNSLQ